MFAVSEEVVGAVIDPLLRRRRGGRPDLPAGPHQSPGGQEAGRPPGGPGVSHQPQLHRQQRGQWRLLWAGEDPSSEVKSGVTTSQI